jgi:hypothetical protein
MNKYLLFRLLLNLFELLACIAGFIYWKKIKKSYWKWLSVYLTVIAITELLAEYIGYQLGNEQLNADINFFFSIPLQFIFFFWLFYKWFESYKERKWPLAGAATYFISLMTELFYFSDKKLWFLSFSYTTGNIVLLVLTLLFFYNFMRSDEILKYKQSMMFWVCLGLLFFYLGSLPFFGLWNTLAIEYPNLFNRYWIVQISLNCLMYLFFAIAFIWGKPK